MAFVNISLLVGGLLIGVPIVLHLMLRQQPRQLVFPALRFVQQRRETNRRTLQLRHWLLLLLRCLAIAFLAAALARPSVNSSALGDWMMIGLLGGLGLVLVLLTCVSLVLRKEVWMTAVLALLSAGVLGTGGVLTLRATADEPPTAVGNRRAPVAAVLVFDTSPRMEYRQANQSRLEQARELADWLIDQLPPDSEVAVAQSHPGALGFSIDLAAAKRTVQMLKTTGVPQPLTSVLQQALDLAHESPLRQKEVYIFTDHTEAAWRDDLAGRLKQQLQDQPNVLVYVIDVGAQDARNFALGELQLSAQRLPRNGELQLEVEVRNIGPAEARTIALLVEDPDATRPIILDGKPLLPETRQRGREVVQVSQDGSQIVQFPLRGLPLGTHQGQVIIEGEDGLPIDDVRYFTVEVQPAWPVLVVAPDSVNTTNFVEALAPYERRVSGQARFECTVIKPSDWANVQLESQQAVCLLDPPSMPPSVWESLAEYVEQGGGLAVFLGYEAGDSKSFNQPAAQQLLPGPLGRQWRSPGRDLFLAPQTFDHPVMAEFRPIASQVPWDEFPVFRHWSFGQLHSGARVVLRYGNGQPAVVETSLGEGRVLTMTTPITEKQRPSGRKPWNELTGPNDWPRFILINEMMLYLVNNRDTRLNYTAGETVTLVNYRDQHPERYQLFAPPDEVRAAQARDEEVVVRATEVPGAYRLKGNLGETVIRGFAVNLPPEASSLDRCLPERLDDVLGAGRYKRARGREEIEVGVGAAREGHEFFPLLIIMLAVILGVEQLLANRFYRQRDAGGES